MTKDSKNLSMLETERLFLRQPSEDAIADVVKHIGDLEVSKWLALVPYPYTEADGIWFVNHCKDEAAKQPREAYDYWMQLKETGETIGGIGLTGVVGDRKRGTIGYWIGTAHHRRGYGTEALRRILDFAFKDLKLETIEACVFTGNPSSGKLFEKFGAKTTGLSEKTHHCKATGEDHKIFEYTLTKDDYEKGRGRDE